MSGRVLQPEGWPRPSGYANGMAATGTVLVTAGQIGWNPVTGTFARDDFTAQVEQALDNVLAVLQAGGAGPADVVRLVWYVTDMETYRAARKDVGAAFRTRFGRHFPAMAVVQVSALLEPRAQVEIEATAVVAERPST